MKPLLAFFLFVSIGASVWGQDACKFGSSDAFDGLAKQLSKAPSCAIAVKKLEACAWGSSADSEFSAIVVHKCESEFFEKLNPEAAKRYENEMQLCSYQYSRAEGTISISEAALCQVGIALKFDKNHLADQGVNTRASFDCGKATSTLELAVCADERLGKADIVLSKVYGNVGASMNAQQKQKLANSEREWLTSVPKKCGIVSPFTPQSLDCARNEFELRFTALGDCDIGPADDCLGEVVEQAKEVASSATDIAPRASFDCDKPTTALQIVVCADHELGQLDVQVTAALKTANETFDSSQHSDLMASEEKWAQFVGDRCPLGVVGGVPPVLARGCIRSAFKIRISQLQSCATKENAERIPCLNDFRILPDQPQSK